jgi:hypothetical protein
MLTQASSTAYEGATDSVAYPMSGLLAAGDAVFHAANYRAP